MKDIIVRATRFFANAQNDRIKADCFASLAKTGWGFVIASLFCEAISLAVVILNEVKDLNLVKTRFFALLRMTDRDCFTSLPGPRSFYSRGRQGQFRMLYSRGKQRVTPSASLLGRKNPG